MRSITLWMESITLHEKRELVCMDNVDLYKVLITFHEKLITLHR